MHKLCLTSSSVITGRGTLHDPLRALLECLEPPLRSHEIPFEPLAQPPLNVERRLRARLLQFSRLPRLTLLA